MRIFLIAFLSFCGSANAAETVAIPWNGELSHNSNHHWSSKDKLYADSGFSKFFQNGTPEEAHVVKKYGQLRAEILPPANVTGSPPFVVLLHGCGGLDALTQKWLHHVADMLNTEGIGVLILDSFSTRGVEKTCGWPDLHWGRRRADDAYSALDYLVEHKLAKPDEIYIMGYSNGGTTTLVAITREERDHPRQFAGAFALAPSCFSDTVRDGQYLVPLVAFLADQDNANDPTLCLKIKMKKAPKPVHLIEYMGANHGFMLNDANHVYNGWKLSFNPKAEKDMMQTIIAAIKTKKFGREVEVRPVGAAELK
jgi:dienelactone hydrolase